MGLNVEYILKYSSQENLPAPYNDDLRVEDFYAHLPCCDRDARRNGFWQDELDLQCLAVLECTNAQVFRKRLLKRLNQYVRFVKD